MKSTTSSVKLDESLCIEDGSLRIEGHLATDLVSRFGSPLFVFSEAQLRRSFRRFKTAFAKHWPGPVEVLPAFKANLALATRHVLSEEGAGADVYSEGELLGVLQSNIEPRLISVNGGGKTDAMLRRCILAGVRITVEDLDEPARINAIAAELGVTAAIRFRVKPNFHSLWQLTDFAPEVVSIDLGIQTYKSGIPQEALAELGRQVLAMENVHLVGLHFHGGRHHAGLWYWRGLMRHYAEVISELYRALGNYKFEELDIGGGFASHRDPHSKLHVRESVIMSWWFRPVDRLVRLFGPKASYKLTQLLVNNFLARHAEPEPAPTIEAYAEAAVATLLEELNTSGVPTDGVRLQLEPGRALYGDAGVHLTTVKTVKRQKTPLELNWILVDTSNFFMAGGVYEHNYHQVVVANKASEAPMQVADIVGQSCYADRLSPFTWVPDVQAGDVLAYLDMGAYQEVSASNFNALPRPASVMVSEGRAELIRRAENIDDIYGRDLVPERFLQSTQTLQEVG